MPEAHGVDTFHAALDRVHHGLFEMGSGRPESYMSCWHPLPQVTLFGAWGPIERGYNRLASTFAWVGSRFSGGALLAEDVEMFSSGDLAYTIGFERGLVSIDGAPSKIMKIRVTHLYRRIDGRWALVHRHADFPPTDPRSASSG